MPLPAVLAAPQVVAAGVAGAAGLLGLGASSAYGASQADKQMRFQERMSSTAHQREMADMRKAGLNPVLSAKYGGASTPPGASAPTPDFNSPINSALSAASMASQIRLQNAQARDVEASATGKENQNYLFSQTEAEQIRMVQAQLYELRSRGKLNEDQSRQLDAAIKRVDAEVKLLDNQAQHSAYDMERARAEAKFYKGVGGDIAPWLDKIMDKLPIPIKAGRR